MRKTAQLMMLIMMHSIFFISCKKEKQIVTPIATPGTPTYSGSSYPAFTTQKDFYIPILDSIENAQLKVYEKSRGYWSDVFPSSTGLSPNYSRNGGVITFRQLIIGWPSVEISVRVTASW